MRTEERPAYLRALALAQSGHFKTISDIQRHLEWEGFGQESWVAHHGLIRMQLNGIMQRAPDPRFDA